MSARIDYAKAALDGLGYIAKTPMSSEVAAVIVTSAQVHATLALVEQQRFANLIAYVAKWTDDEVLDVDAEIREALGLS